MNSCHWQKADHDPDARHACLTKRASILSLLIDPPDQADFLSYRRSEGFPDRVNEAGETRSEDNEIEVKLSAASEEILESCRLQMNAG